MTRTGPLFGLFCAAFLLGAAVVGSVALSSPDLPFPVPAVSVYEKADAGKSSAAVKEAGPARKINVNRAGAAELESLPGIGPKTAQAILDYRAEHGRFRQRRDLMKVKGIGEKTYDQLKDLVTTA